MRCMAKDPDTALPLDGRGARGAEARRRRAMTATVSGVGATGEYRTMGGSGGYSDSGPSGSGKPSSGPHSRHLAARARSPRR